MSRWLRNLGVYLALVAVATLALGMVALASDGGLSNGGEVGEAIATWIIFTLVVVVGGLVALIPYLLVVEFVLRRGGRRRLAAVALGALVAGGGLTLSQLGHLTFTAASLVVVLGCGVLGALYGALVRLPPVPIPDDGPPT